MFGTSENIITSVRKDNRLQATQELILSQQWHIVSWTFVSIGSINGFEPGGTKLQPEPTLKNRPWRPQKHVSTRYYSKYIFAYQKTKSGNVFCKTVGTSYRHYYMKWRKETLMSALMSGGRFKNAYELLNLRALNIPMLYKNRIFQCMSKIFCVEFQRVPLKFHTQYLTHTLKDMNFIHRWNFKSS